MDTKQLHSNIQPKRWNGRPNKQISNIRPSLRNPTNTNKNRLHIQQLETKQQYNNIIKHSSNSRCTHTNSRLDPNSIHNHIRLQRRFTSTRFNRNNNIHNRRHSNTTNSNKNRLQLRRMERTRSRRQHSSNTNICNNRKQKLSSSIHKWSCKLQNTPLCRKCK